MKKLSFFEESPFIVVNEDDFKKLKTDRRVVFSNTLKKVAMAIVISCVIIIASGVTQRIRWYYYDNRSQAKRERFETEWNNKTADEKLVWMIKDMFKDDNTVIEVSVDYESNAICVYIDDKGFSSPEIWDARIEFQKNISSIAKDSGVTKEIIVIGVSEERILWNIGDDGFINMEGDDEIEL